MVGVFLIFGFLLITTWGVVLGRRQRISEYTSNRDRGSASEVYCTLLSSLVGGWMFFGLNAIGFEAGLVGVAIGIGYVLGLGLLFWLVPRIKSVMTSGPFDTLDEFIGHHYGRAAQTLLAVTNFAIFVSVLSAQFMAMQSYLRVIAPEFAGWLPIAAAISVVLYTSIGGYKGVAVTDILKMIVLVLGVGGFAAIVLSQTGPEAWSNVPVTHWSFTGYGSVFLAGAVVLFPPTILVRSDLWQRVVHASSPRTARRAIAQAMPSLLAFYVILTVLGMASRGRLGPSAVKESAGLLVLHHDVLALPVPSELASLLVSLISFGIFAALASTADNNLNIAAIGLSKLFLRRDWEALRREAATPEGTDDTGAERRLLRRSRAICLAVGGCSVGAALFLDDIVAVMVNAASVMMLFLPATIASLLFGTRSRWAGLLSVVTGLGVYFTVLAVGVDLKSAFVPGFLASTTVFGLTVALERRLRREFQHYTEGTE